MRSTCASRSPGRAGDRPARDRGRPTEAALLAGVAVVRPVVAGVPVRGSPRPRVVAARGGVARFAAGLRDDRLAWAVSGVRGARALAAPRLAVDGGGWSVSASLAVGVYLSR